MDNAISHGKSEITQFAARVRTLSPQATLDRGYAVVQKPDGSIIRAAKDLVKGDGLELRLADGVALATATGESKN